MLNIKILSLGATVFFVPNGTAITPTAGAGTSGPGNKPDDTTPADWASLTRIKELSLASKADEEDVMAPAPGAYRRVDKFRSMLSLDLTFAGHDTNELVFQSAFQTGAITDGTPFTPQSKLGQIRGWMKITSLSQNDATTLDCELYGILTVSGWKADGKKMNPEFTFAVLHNALATGTSTLAAA